MKDATDVPGSRGCQSRWAGLVDDQEGYGAHIVNAFARRIPAPAVTLDIGAGGGRDLDIIKTAHPGTRTIAIDWATTAWHERFDSAHALDVEHDLLPAAASSVDLVIANQVLEHLKEIFWIWHEVSRILKTGGHFLVGVPNITSLHNRLLLAVGEHPTQWKSYSAHVRPFSKPDTQRFVNVCFPRGYALVAFRGAQFYPLPVALARPMCSIWPAAAASIFFLFRKEREYQGEFLAHPVRARLETNFYLGKSA
jgi:SAM-dependent methyltransferase